MWRTVVVNPGIGQRLLLCEHPQRPYEFWCPTAAGLADGLWPVFLTRPCRPMDLHRSGIEREHLRLDADKLLCRQLLKTPGPARRSSPNDSCACQPYAKGRRASVARATCSLTWPHTELHSAPAGYLDLHCRAALGRAFLMRAYRSSVSSILRTFYLFTVL